MREVLTHPLHREEIKGEKVITNSSCVQEIKLGFKPSMSNNEVIQPLLLSYKVGDFFY